MPQHNLAACGVWYGCRAWLHFVMPYLRIMVSMRLVGTIAAVCIGICVLSMFDMVDLLYNILMLIVPLCSCLML